MGLFLANLPATILHYYRSLKFPKSVSPFKVAIGEVVMLQEKEYMTLNTDTLKINQKLSSFVESVTASKYPYKASICRLMQVERPKLFYLTKTLPSITQYWQKAVKDGNIDIILFCTCDILSNKIEFDIFYPQQDISNANIPFEEFRIVFSRKIKESEDIETYVVGVFQFYAAICGQAILDLMINMGDFSNAHKVVDDAETLLKDSVSILADFFKSEKQDKFQNFCNMWLAGFERYRSLLFLNQKEYSGALDHVIRSAKIWPYYPYRNYAEYKDSFVKKYMGEINLKASEFIPLLDDNTEDSQEKVDRATEMMFQGLDLFSRVENVDTPSTDQIIKWIMAEADSADFYKEVEKVMTEEISIFPVDQMIKSEVLKYIPKGTAKSDALYIDRIPEILVLLKKILEGDTEFTVIYLKIGTLMFIQSCEVENEKDKEVHLKAAMAIMKKGMVLYHRMGTIKDSRNGIDD